MPQMTEQQFENAVKAKRAAITRLRNKAKKSTNLKLADKVEMYRQAKVMDSELTAFRMKFFELTA